MADTGRTVWADDLWADDFWAAGFWSSGEAAQSKFNNAGSSKKKRYIVEVDNQLFHVNTIAEANGILAQVRDLADDSAQKDVTTPTVPKPPKIKVKTLSGKPSTSKVIQQEVKKTQKVVNHAYIKRANEIAQDIEISELMLKTIQREQEQDEEAIIALLLL